MRGLPLWIFLTEGKFGGLLLGGGCRGLCAAARKVEGAADAVLVEMGERGKQNHLAHLRIARELPRWSLKNPLLWRQWGS